MRPGVCAPVGGGAAWVRWKVEACAAQGAPAALESICVQSTCAEHVCSSLGSVGLACPSRI